MRLTLLALLTLFLLSGCGGVSQKELDFASETVQTALETWKKGEKSDSLKSRSAPIDFHDDDWKKGAKLVSYEMKQTYDPRDGSSPRCAVVLTMELRGRRVQREVTYEVHTKPKVLVARDPMS